MTTHATFDAVPRASKRAQAGLGSAEAAQACLALLGKLEDSLAASQRALLARNLQGIESGTREQARLVDELSALCGAGEKTAPPADLRAAGGDGEAAGDGEVPGKNEVPGESQAALLCGVRAAGRRVLQSARVQAALLARAARRQKMISHLLAGPQQTYETVVAGEPGNPAPPGEGGAKPVCRA